jgi:repressor LexA
MLNMHAQTRRQREVLDYISRYIDTHGYRPSYQVIARHMGVNSRAGIARIVHDLEAQGLLTRRRENGHFYIDVGGQAKQANGNNGAAVIDWLDLPATSEPDDALANCTFTVPEFILNGYDPEVIRAFRVNDDAMAGESICEDDVALIEVREFARDGQRVVAVLDDGRIVLRRYHRDGAEVQLSAAGDDHEVIRMTADRIEIKGVFRGLLRPLS